MAEVTLTIEATPRCDFSGCSKMRPTRTLRLQFTRRDVRVGLRLAGWRRTVTIAFAVDEAALRVDIAGLFYRGRDVAEAMAKRE